MEHAEPTGHVLKVHLLRYPGSKSKQCAPELGNGRAGAVPAIVLLILGVVVFRLLVWSSEPTGLVLKVYLSPYPRLKSKQRVRELGNECFDPFESRCGACHCAAYTGGSGVPFVGMELGTYWPCPESTSVTLPKFKIKATCARAWKRMFDPFESRCVVPAVVLLILGVVVFRSLVWSSEPTGLVLKVHLSHYPSSKSKQRARELGNECFDSLESRCGACRGAAYTGGSGVPFFGMELGTYWPCPESTSVALPKVEMKATCARAWKRMF
jgi:hypothetical protein